MVLKLFRGIDGSIRLILLALVIVGGLFTASLYRVLLGRRWYLTRLGLFTKKTWMRITCTVIGIQIGRYGIPSRMPALLVANHVSWIDVIVLGSVMSCAFVAKHDVRNWPVLGMLADLAGTVFINRESPKQALRSMSGIQEILEKGVGVTVFPEGTTSNGNTVLPFQPLLFEAAVRGAYDVQATALHYPGNTGDEARVPFVGDAAFFPHLLQLLYGPRIRADVYFCQKLRYSAERTRRQLCDTTYRQVKDVI